MFHLFIKENILKLKFIFISIFLPDARKPFSFKKKKDLINDFEKIAVLLVLN